MYQNVFPDGFCHHVISEFERLLVSGACYNRQDSEGTTKTRKQDFHYFLNMRNNVMDNFNDVRYIFACISINVSLAHKIYILCCIASYNCVKIHS